LLLGLRVGHLLLLGGREATDEMPHALLHGR
jgi:hypothetical protein